MIMYKRYMLLFIVVLCGYLGNCAEENDILYKVVNIRTKGEYFVIIVERNDSLFKIMSKKVTTKPSHLVKIEKGGCYYFDFGYGRERITGKPLSGNASYLHVEKKRFVTLGNTKFRFKKRFNNRLCTNVNLIGLYYIPVSGDDPNGNGSDMLNRDK